MRLVARFIVGVAVVLLLAGAALFFMRKPIVEGAVERLMAKTGLIDPQVTLSDVSLSRATLARIEAGADKSAPALSLDDVVLEYGWRELLFERKLRAMHIGDGAIVVASADDGSIDIAGWSPDPNAPRAPPPVAALIVEKLDVIANVLEGEARFGVSGVFDYAKGGKFEIVVASDETGIAGASPGGVAGDLDIALGTDGSITATGALNGDIATPIGAARGVDADFSAALASWRGIFGDGPWPLTGEATLTLNSSTIDPSATPAPSPVGPVSAAGSLKAVFANGGYAVSVADGPLTLANGRGDTLLLSAGDKPLLESRDGERRLSLNAQFGGDLAEGTASLDAASSGNGPWRVEASALLGDQTIGGVAIENFEGAFRGDFADSKFAGEAEITTHIKSADIGRLKITDMPAAGRLALEVDANQRLVTATPIGETCLDIERAKLAMAEQDLRVSGAALCAVASPLFAVTWGETAKTHVEGVLTGQAARYAIGRTIFDGAPPKIDFALDYEPRINTTNIAGEIAGGRLLLNKAFILTDAAGRFEADIVDGAMSANSSLSAMRIAQNAELVMVAPVAVAGEAALAKDLAKFDFSVATPNGASLGKGDGGHNVKTGRGDAVFDSGLLRFAPGFQPDRLLPALRGVISNATGTAEGRARYTWAPGEIASSATVNLDNVSFSGPGVAVTRTEGVTGKIVFSSLGPVATAGEQTLSIRKIDLDALKLENGGMRFALPGDQTLKIVEAEFPWFGGTIGAYDSTMSIGGGKAETTLQIDNVNLSQLLGYINVEGLSGEGVIEGVLPLTFEDGKARINNGILSSEGPGVIRYEGKAATAASQSNDQSALAFEVLRELRFDKLAATIDGALAGTIDFNILFEGRSDIPVKTGGKTQTVDSPVKYRITINAPLLSLIDQARLSTDIRQQIERAREQEEAGPKAD